MTQVLDHGDGIRIDAVVCFYVVLVKAFAHVVDAVVPSVVEHHHLAASLVIDSASFQDGTANGVSDVVAYEAVAVVSQVESAEFAVRLLAGFEQRVFEFSVLVLFAHHDGDGFLVFEPAVAAHDGNARFDVPARFFR